MNDERAKIETGTIGAAIDLCQAPWPDLDRIGLSSSAQRMRSRAVGGSDANIILSGDPERILRLWREKRGEEKPEDLTSVLPVMMGQWTEAFNRQWYQRMTGEIVEGVGMVAIAPDLAWRRATLDGFVNAKSSIWEAKHVNAFAKPEDVLARYMPQLQHNMAVIGLPSATLSVLFGNHKWEVFEVASDWLYQDELLNAEQSFWRCVIEGALPASLPAPPPPKPVGVREVCLEGNNLWAAAAADWQLHREAARLHAAAVKHLKELVEADVSRAWGHGIEARRSKTGALSIKEQL